MYVVIDEEALKFELDNTSKVLETFEFSKKSLILEALLVEKEGATFAMESKSLSSLILTWMSISPAVNIAAIWSWLDDGME